MAKIVKKAKVNAKPEKYLDYAFNTKEEVAVLVKYYTQQIALLSKADDIDTSAQVIKLVDHIRFLQNQFTRIKTPPY